jgi:hypothetical protein
MTPDERHELIAGVARHPDSTVGEVAIVRLLAELCEGIEFLVYEAQRWRHRQ